MDIYRQALQYMLHGTTSLKDVDLFLGGTISTNYDWRRELVQYIDQSISYYDPYLRNDERGDLDWDESMIDLEAKAKEFAKLNIFVITSDMEGVYSIAEITEAAMKLHSRTIVAIIDYDNKFNPRQKRSFGACMKLWKSHGAIIAKDLHAMARYINQYYYTH